jgi:hypothetical protein
MLKNIFRNIFIGTYSDTDKYRFIISRNQNSFYDFNTHNRVYDEKIWMLDKKTGKSYSTKGNGGAYGKLLKAYSQALESAR